MYKVLKKTKRIKGDTSEQWLPSWGGRDWNWLERSIKELLGCWKVFKTWLGWCLHGYMWLSGPTEPWRCVHFMIFKLRLHSLEDNVWEEIIFRGWFLLKDTCSYYILICPWPDPCGASLRAQLVKNPPAMQDILVQSLGWEDQLEKG